MDAPDKRTNASSKYNSRQLNKLCDSCEAVFPADGPWLPEKEGTRKTDYGDWIVRDFTIRDIHESAEAGCHLCRVFLDSQLPPDMIVGKRHSYSKWYEINKESRIQCTLCKHWADQLDTMGRKDGRFSMELKVLSDNGSGRKSLWNPIGDFVERYDPLHFLRFQPVRPLTPGEAIDKTTWVTEVGEKTSLYRTDSLSGIPFTLVQSASTTSFNPSSFAQVRKWVTECLESHEDCTNWKSTLSETFNYQRKIRLVDVGTEERPVLRLVDGESLVNGTGGIKYVTLSYRWTAETNVISMKGHNKAIYQDSIPAEGLPQVYKDAATFARAIGVRYVWIDSLCIIQDSRDDWNEQSSLMDQIYTNGLLNLSAMFGDRSSSLEIERDPLAVSPCLLTRPLPNDPKSKNGEQLYEHWVCFDGYGINSFVGFAPLFKRAWCYQERLLPIRTVYFGEQFIWQCQRNMANECTPSYIDRGLANRLNLDAARQHDLMVRFPLSKAYEARTQLDKSRKEQDSKLLPANANWYWLLAEYSNMEITNLADRLVALRGIFNRVAEAYEDLQPDWCVAGMWKSDLIGQLLWHPGNGREKADHRTTARAKELLELFPSWSWASCPTPAYNSSLFEPCRKSVIMIEIQSIQPGQPLGPDATYTAFETSSRIVMKGLLDAEFDSETLARSWAADSINMKTMRASFSFDGEQATQLDVELYFDRPMIEPVKPQDLKLLPFQIQVHFGPMPGLVLASVGMREGVPTYRRVGSFSADYEFLKPEYLYTQDGLYELYEEDVKKAKSKFTDRKKDCTVFQLV